MPEGAVELCDEDGRSESGIGGIGKRGWFRGFRLSVGRSGGVFGRVGDIFRLRELCESAFLSVRGVERDNFDSDGGDAMFSSACSIVFCEKMLG